ncbi:MAG: GNAT family N-acetyltransferase [Gammaproteobacteria bacterium]|jgi:ribosomal protein S18 acetylase RimI-like enzyme
MRVRKAVPEDLNVIVDFISLEAMDAEGRIQDRETLEQGVGAGLRDSAISDYWLLVDDREQAAGCVSVIKEWSDWNAGYYWWIQSMYISPEYRGKGFMSLLIDTVAKSGRQQNCLELRLYVHTNNKAAIRAYEKAEFEYMPYRLMSKRI